MIVTSQLKIEDTKKWITEGYDCKTIKPDLNEAIEAAKIYEEQGLSVRINLRGWAYIYVKKVTEEKYYKTMSLMATLLMLAVAIVMIFSS